MDKTKTRAISGGASFLLDFLRLGAALTVMYIHGLRMWFPNLPHNTNAPGDSANAAVVTFFVLSGYVIAHSTSGNNRGPLHYAQARLSRLYSVLLPALVLTAVVEIIITRIAPTLAAEYSRNLPWLRYLSVGSFFNEIWFVSAAPLINSPFWSLGFEFWYYVIFGVWFYRSAGIKSQLLLAVACLVAGPKILVMMPLWAAGVLAYRLPRPRLPVAVAWLLVGVSLLAAELVVLYVPPFPFDVGYAPWFFAGKFVTDWGIGFFIAGALWVLPTSATTWPSASWVVRFRKIADMTFPLYVLHYPLLILWRGIFGQRLNDAGQLAQALTTVFVVAVVIGGLLEKQRPLWVNFFNWLLNLLTPNTINKSVAMQQKNLAPGETEVPAPALSYTPTPE